MVAISELVPKKFHSTCLSVDGFQTRAERFFGEIFQDSQKVFSLKNKYDISFGFSKVVIWKVFSHSDFEMATLLFREFTGSVIFSISLLPLKKIFHIGV